MPQRSHIRRKTYTQQIRVVDRSVFVRQAQNITRPRTPRLKRLHRVLQTAYAGSPILEIPQKRIASAQRKKSQHCDGVFPGT